jgi:hypothetical protein
MEYRQLCSNIYVIQIADIIAPNETCMRYYIAIPTRVAMQGTKNFIANKLPDQHRLHPEIKQYQANNWTFMEVSFSNLLVD